MPKAGTSDFTEQHHLLAQFIDEFGVVGVRGLLADREFANGKLLQWLNDQGIAFYIRIKEKTRVCLRQKRWTTAKHLFNELNLRCQKPFLMSVWIYGAKVYLAGSRSERGELMIVATNQKPQQAIAIYLRRWEIENLFQNLKTRGFCLESTHITQFVRLKKLIAVLAIAAAWAHKVGEWKALIKPIIWKAFRKQIRPQASYFRYGLDHLREIILSKKSRHSQMAHCFTLILTPLELSP